MLPKWQKGIVTKIEQATAGTRRYFITLPEAERFDFIPGQFVTADLPIHEKRNKRWRSYSIASMPDGTNIIELVIVYLDGGLGTTYLFNQVDEGAEVILRGPQGVFTLPENLDNDFFFVCTGTGIAPFRSMLHYIKEHKLPHKELHLIFGTRTQKDLLYYDEMKQLEKELEGFHYHPVLSREKWDGEEGYVHDVYEKVCANKPNAQFMLCGWKMMVDDARKRLEQMGYDKKQVHFELYG